MIEMVKIAIPGAAGRMGQELVRTCQDTAGVETGAASEHSESRAIGRDSGEIAGVEANGVLISDNLDAEAFDVLVDFTRAFRLQGTSSVGEVQREAGVTVTMIP